MRSNLHVAAVFVIVVADCESTLHARKLQGFDVPEEGDDDNSAEYFHQSHELHGRLREAAGTSQSPASCSDHFYDGETGLAPLVPVGLESVLVRATPHDWCSTS